MANGLYDTGKPQRIIVEHEVRHTVAVQHRERECIESPGWTCQEVNEEFGVCSSCPYNLIQYPSSDRAARPVTITPEFQVIDEPKLLK
jgi:hypothetical protein